MKQAEAGKLPDPTGSVAEARHRATFKAGIVMDDKTLKIEIPWLTIRETSEAGLAEFILKQMRGETDAAH